MARIPLSGDFICIRINRLLTLQADGRTLHSEHPSIEHEVIDDLGRGTGMPEKRRLRIFRLAAGQNQFDVHPALDNAGGALFQERSG